MSTQHTDEKTTESPDVLDVLLDLEEAVGRLETSVQRAASRALATDAAVRRIEARITRTESRLCQFMQDQGSEIYLLDPGGV